MENHKPQKRHQAIVSFSKDHHFGLLLVWKIRQGLKQAVNPERIGHYVTFCFNEDLHKHFREEEELLFTKLPVNDALRLKAENDHHVINALVAAVGMEKDDAVLLNQLADELEKHIRFEERELFNHLQDSISVDELVLIEKRLPNSSKAIDEKWPDLFWEIKN